MNIALLTNGLYPFIVGGMQKHSFYLARFLAKKEMEVDIYHIAEEKDKQIKDINSFSDDEKKHIQEFRFPFPSVPQFPGHYLRESYLYSEAVFEQLKSRLHLYDLIYVQGFSGWKLINKINKGLQAPPVCLNFHGLEMFQISTGIKNYWANKLMAHWVRKLLGKADFVQSLGGKLTNILINNGVKKEQIIEMPIGIDKDWIKDETPTINTPRKFVFIGRYERRKGIEEINKLLIELKESYDFEFHFIGPIPSHLQIFSDNIKYWGYINDSQHIQEILQGKDFLMCPSYSEGMPTVILEAMASGLAILATDVGAVSKEVSENNGWLFPPADYERLKKVFIKALETSETELVQMKEYSIQKVENQFTWNKVIELMLKKINAKMISQMK